MGDLLKLAGLFAGDRPLDRDRTGLRDLEGSGLLAGDADLPLSSTSLLASAILTI